MSHPFHRSRTLQKQTVPVHINTVLFNVLQMMKYYFFHCGMKLIIRYSFAHKEPRREHFGCDLRIATNSSLVVLHCSFCLLHVRMSMLKLQISTIFVIDEPTPIIDGNRLLETIISKYNLPQFEASNSE